MKFYILIDGISTILIIISGVRYLSHINKSFIRRLFLLIYYCYNYCVITYGDNFYFFNKIIFFIIFSSYKKISLLQEILAPTLIIKSSRFATLETKGNVFPIVSVCLLLSLLLLASVVTITIEKVTPLNRTSKHFYRVSKKNSKLLKNS